MSDQKELLASIQNGDEQALTELIRAELPKVFNLSLRLCGSKTEAEDLSQDVFVRVIRGLPDFRGEANISSWIYRVVMNTWKNKVRSEKRRFQSKHVPLIKTTNDGEDTMENEPVDPSVAPEIVAELTEDHAHLLRAIELLDKDEKMVVVLRDIEQKSYEEIVEILNIRMGTLKSKLSRAREHLREICHLLEAKLL